MKNDGKIDYYKLFDIEKQEDDAYQDIDEYENNFYDDEDRKMEIIHDLEEKNKNLFNELYDAHEKIKVSEKKCDSLLYDIDLLGISVSTFISTIGVFFALFYLKAAIFTGEFTTVLFTFIGVSLLFFFFAWCIYKISHALAFFISYDITSYNEHNSKSSHICFLTKIISILVSPVLSLLLFGAIRLILNNI
jgi:hypothetical protein